MTGPRRRLVCRTVLAAGVLLLLDMTLRWMPSDHPPPILVPFRSIRYDWHAGGEQLWVNLVGNVAAFVPLGALLPASRVRPTAAWQAALFGFALSAPIELAQYLSGRRTADVDDLILNTLGALIGFGFYALFRRFRPGPDPAPRCP